MKWIHSLQLLIEKKEVTKTKEILTAEEQKSMQKGSVPALPLLFSAIQTRRLHRYQHGRIILWILMLFCAISGMISMAFAPPHIMFSGTERRIICLDISRSMLAADGAWKDQEQSVTRLEQARILIEEMMRQHTHDEYALMVFAGEAAVISPFVQDYKSLIEILTTIEPGFLQTRGSSITSLLGLLSDRFPAVSYSSLPISAILFTDGDFPADIGKSDIGFPIHGIIVGRPAPMTVSVDSTSSITTQSNTTSLHHLAEQTGGMIFQASAYASASALLRDLDDSAPSSLSMTDSIIASGMALITLIIERPAFTLGILCILLLVCDLFIHIIFPWLVYERGIFSPGIHRLKSFLLLMSIYAIVWIISGCFVFPISLSAQSVSPISSSLRRAVQLVQTHHYAEAEETLQRFLQKESIAPNEQAIALYYRATARYHTGQWQSAYDDARTLHTIPSQAIPYQTQEMLCALCAYALRSYPTAIEHTQCVLRMNPGDTTAQRLLTLCFQKQRHINQQKLKQSQQQQRKQITQSPSIESAGRTAFTSIKKQQSSSSKGID